MPDKPLFYAQLMVQILLGALSKPLIHFFSRYVAAQFESHFIMKSHPFATLREFIVPLIYIIPLPLLS
ncbi:hypothetical protein [Shewanella sp. CAL98-MNA-CIBAN-0140]|uniref:hypothetical protein n=1 Tax=Shewanella sp. CAL98-MNA-CIBAN-0140 TaxID=3140462 RepID=UPI0033184840